MLSTLATRHPPEPRLRTLLRPLALLVLVLVTLAGVAHGAGGLALLTTQANGIGGVEGLNGVRTVALAPDGRTLYTASDVSSSITSFTRDPATGALRFAARWQDNTDGVDGLDHVRGLALSPDGTSLYAAGEADDALAVFQRDSATGALVFLEVQRDGVADADGLDGARGVVVSADGAHVYVTASRDNTVALFQRDPETGGLAFVELLRDGVDGANGLNGADGLALSPDGQTLYVASPGDTSLAVFARDPATGQLTYLERHQHSVAEPDGLDGVKTVIVSPDGAHVYAGGKLDDAIAIFSRDPATGALTFSSRLRDGVDGVDGLDGVDALAMTADGSLLYATGSNENSVAAFARDPETGALTFLELQRDGTGTIDHLGDPKGLVLDPAGLYLYVAAARADAVTTFSTRCGDATLDAEEQCDDGNTDAGDGCSPGCRRECGVPEDCDDADPCTEEHCRGAECALPECGVDGALCQLAAAGTALARADACFPLDRPLGRTIRLNLRAARQAMLHTRHQTHPSAHALITRVAKLLDTIDAKADRLFGRVRLSADCAAAVHDETAALGAALEQSLSRAGLCTP